MSNNTKQPMSPKPQQPINQPPPMILREHVEPPRPWPTIPTPKKENNH